MHVVEEGLVRKYNILRPQVQHSVHAIREVAEVNVKMDTEND